MDVPANSAGTNAQLKAILEKNFFILDNLLKNAMDPIGFASRMTMKMHIKTNPGTESGMTLLLLGSLLTCLLLLVAHGSYLKGL
jgi:hypothetical protein